jgi:outer membrane lipoprotein-sorting protein
MASVNVRVLAPAMTMLALATAAQARPLESSRALLARLRATGRGEAAITGRGEAAIVLHRTDPETRVSRSTRGRLVLELPGRARLEFPSTGEVLTLREDGGDWLQPGPKQLLRAGPRSAGAAMQWWAALLDSGATFRETPLGGRGFTLTPVGGDSTDAQRVWLAAGGLPARLEITTAAGEIQRFDLSAWRFTRPRGRRAFVLEAPPGFETVELP